MEKLKEKERVKQEKSLKIKEQKQREAANKMLEDEQVSTIFKYCRKVLQQPLTESLSEYCPTNLSKFIFQQQLEKARVIFQELPDKQSKLQHFLLMMISIMKFPFEKWPYYLVGFKEMFNQIVPQKRNAIKYSHFFKYIIGQVLDFKEQDQNTEFQVRFQELKKQDYLMHDTGISKFYYSTDTKIFMTLDFSSYVIKFYNKEMKMLNKFTPNKQKHHKKYPNILSFDYSEMSNRLGVTYANKTVSIINFQSFLTKSKQDFESVNSNQIVIEMEEKILQIFYIQMLNRWALFSQQNRLLILDMEKYRQNDPDYLVEVKLENSDLKLVHLLELVNSSMICLVAGNQIYFYNQNFTEKKHCKFSHGTNIKLLRHSEQNGSFYISGDEKVVTIFNMIRHSDNFNISTFSAQSKYDISTFEVFPLFNTIVIVDRNNDARLCDLLTSACFQQASYDHIVKNKENQIKMLKISKTQFALYQTYNLVFKKEKIAIEKDSLFEFKNDNYFDAAKEQFYFSANNQIISFSVPQGQIRKSYNMDTANVPKHYCFLVGKQTDLFIIDHQRSIYDVFLKDAMTDGDTKGYKKTLGMIKIAAAFYDEELRALFVVGPWKINTVRNDGNNNFHIVSTLSLEGFPEMVSAKYNVHTKQMQIMFPTQQWAIIDIERLVLKELYSLNFPKNPKNHSDIIVTSHDHDIFYDLDIIMTNHNQVYFISKTDRTQFLFINIPDYLPYKQRELEFTTFKYCGDDRSQIYLLLSDKTGYLLTLNITKTIKAKFAETERPYKAYRFLMKDLHTIQNLNYTFKQIQIPETKPAQVDKKHTSLFKAHEKEIQIMQRIDIQGMKTLTFAVDGHIKLWSENELLFHLKLPDLKKLVWNMDKIEKIKNERSISEVMAVINQLENDEERSSSPEILLKINNQKKNDKKLIQVKNINFDEPIPLEIDNKDIEEIVHKTHNINWYSQKPDLKKRDRDLSLTQRVNPHPWRTKNSFLKIMDKASPQNKYKKKIPKDLISLRTSLDMRDRRESRKEEESQIPILPQLKKIMALSKKQQTRNKTPKNIAVAEEQNEEAFESCLYVKSTRNHKKTNELDEIDKQFKKKWLALTAKKYIPKSDRSNKKSLTDQKNKLEQYYAPVRQFKYDAIKEVKTIFEEHNKEVSMSKKGHYIKIPDLSLTKDDIFPND